MSDQKEFVDHPDQVVHNELIDIIKCQTSIDDTLFIERTLMECNNDVPKTILKLMNLLPDEIQKEPTDIDVFREILNEKDRIYHEVMDKKRTQ